MSLGKGLGRGFESLIPTELVDDEFDPTILEDKKESKLEELDLSEIIRDEEQPRKEFSEEAIAALSASIKEHGVLQPIVVTREDGKYKIVAGERRWRASKMAGLKKIPAIIRTLDSQNRLELSIIENAQREDCAQAHGAMYKGKSAGSIGHIGAWSFCQDKIMTTGGEGGMVTTNDEHLWKTMWSYKDHGKNFDSVYNKQHPPGFRWLHDSFGTNWRMMEMQAVIGRLQLKEMPEWTVKRNANMARIQAIFENSPYFTVAKPSTDYVHAAYKCYVQVNTDTLPEAWSRDRIMAEISAQAVPCFSGSCSEVYLEKAFDGTKWRPEQPLANAKALGESSLMFLVHPTLSEQSIQKTIDAIQFVITKI